MPEFVASAINEMLDWFTGFASPPAVATRYITVFDGDPQGAGTEVINTITGSANRINMTTALSAAAAGVQTNNAIITFTASAVGAADVDYIAIYDAQTGGNLMGSTAVSPKSVGVGDALTIPVGNLDFAIT